MQINGEETFVERVLTKDLADWRKTKMLGQADIRLLGDHKDASGRRRLDLAQAVALMKQHEEVGSRFQGPEPAGSFMRRWHQARAILFPTIQNGYGCQVSPADPVRQ